MKKILLVIVVLGVAALLVVLLMLPDGGPPLTSGSLSEPLLLERGAHSVDSGGTRYCKPNGDGSYPGGLAPVRKGEGPDHLWAEGGACVHRPILEVWGALFNHDLMKWNRAHRYEVAHPPPPEGVTYHHDVTYYRTEIMTVDWTMGWSHTVTEGTHEAPEVIVINYRKTAGTPFIAYWEGTMVLTRLAEGVTAVTLRNQIKAARTDMERNAHIITKLYHKLAEGEPAPLPRDRFRAE